MPTNALIRGYRRFYANHFAGDAKSYAELKNTQSPKILVIACSDSRVDPSIIMDTGPGDIFVIRNVANLVPPYQPDSGTYHGTSAALEFGIKGLGIQHIVVLGHSGCAGVARLLTGPQESDNAYSFVDSWVSIAKEAREITLRDAPPEAQAACCEREAIRVSLRNLRSFPWIQSAVIAGELHIHGWYFSIKDGKLHVLNQNIDRFEEVQHDVATSA